MGKKNDEELDDFGLDDLDSDLDFGDWDEPDNGSGSPENRDPIKQTASTVKNAAIGAVFPKSHRDRIILDALPEEATGAYEGYKDVESAVSDVYSHTKEELIKTQRNLKVQTRQLLPTMKKYLPESITSKVDEWTKPDDIWGNNYDPNQALLDRGMAEVFGQYMQQQEERETANSEQQQQEAQDAQSKEVQDGIKETITNLKQDKLLEVMIGMSKDVNSFNNLQHSVTVNWQRKSLELQYRQLFALQEIAKVSQSRFERDTPALEAIVKNTALPDYAKEEFGEIQGALFKRKIAEWISPARYTEEFITRVQDNAKKKVTEALGEGRNLMDLIMGGLQEDDDVDMVDNGVVAPDQQKDNLTQKGISTVTSALAHKYINPQRDKLTAKIREKMSENEDVDRFFNRALYGFQNIPQIANSAMAGERDSALGSFFKTLNDLGIAPSYSREQVSLESRDGDYLDKVAKFDNRSYLTLNEVIPSWLAKINQSIRAGYGEDTDEVYDVTARTFVDRDTVASRVRDYVGQDDHRERLRNRISEVTNLIDTKGELSAEQRAKIGKFLESRISEAKEFNVEAILKNSEVLDRHMDWDTKDKFTEVLRREAGNNAAKLSNKVNEELGGMMGSIGSYQNRVNQMIAQYGEQTLIDSGIINYNAEEDRLETVKGLTDVYQDLGKLERRKLDPETEAKLQARFNRATSAPVPETDVALRKSMGRKTKRGPGKGRHTETVSHTPLQPKNIIAGLTRLDLQEVLYGKENKDTNLIDLIRGDKTKEENQPVRVDLESVVNAIKECCSKETIEAILGHVKRMDEEGIITLSTGKTFDGGEGKDTDPRFRKARFRDYFKFNRVRRKAEGEEGEEKKERKGFFGRAGGIVSDTFGLAQDTAVGGAKWFGGKVFGRKEQDPNKPRQSVLDRMKSIVGGPVKTGFEAVRSIPRGFGAFGKAAFGARDIYDGEGNIVLSGQKLKDGHYFKKVGEKFIPMTTIEELNKAEAIYDSTGNVILSSEQLKEAGELSFYKGKRWWKVTEVVGDKLGGGLNTLVTLPKQLLAGKKNPIKEAVKWFGRYPDMYVGGKLVIRANLMREGHYLCNGKVINSPEDIKGEVRDINDRVVISEEDFKQENFKITDRYGREVRTPLGRMAGRLGNVFGRVQQGLLNIPRRAKIAARTVKRSRPAKFLKRNVADPITNTLSKPFKWMAFGGKDKKEPKEGGNVGWFSQNVIGGGTRGKTNGILVRIYQLLNARMAGDPESEDWINQMGVESTGRMGQKMSAAKDRIKDMFKRRKEAAEKRFDLKGKMAKLKPKNVKEAILARFRKSSKADLSEAKDKLVNRKGAAANFYRDRMAKNIADRESSFLDKVKKVNPKDMVKQVKDTNFKTSFEKMREKLSGKKKEIENTETGRKVRRKVKDTVSGRNRKLDEAALSLLERKGGTREHYRDQLARRIKELKEDNHEQMTSGVRGRVNEAIFGMKRKEGTPLKERFTKKKDDIQAKMLEKLNQMNEASQGMWFNTMQSTAEKNGMSQQGISNLFSRFGKRFQFGKQSAGRDWFSFMKRGGAPEDNDTVGVDPRSKKAKKQKRRGKGLRWVDMLLTGIGAIVGGLPGAIAGALIRPLGGMLLKAVGRGAVGLAAKALPAIAGVAGTAVTAVGGAATAAAGAVATGVAAIGGLPVIVAGAAIAAVGWGIYKLATRKRAYYLDKLRLAQYGLQDYDLWSTDEAAKVRYLEVQLRKYVTFETTGAAILRGLSAEEAVKLGEGYGIDKENEKELVAFHAYLQNRFIPLYLNWLAAIRKVESAPALEDIGSSTKVRKHEMQQVFNEVKQSADSPYFKQIVDPRKADRGWFKSATDWVGFTTDELLTGEEVEEVTAEVGKEIAARRDDRKRKDDKSVKLDSSVAATFKENDVKAALWKEKAVEDRAIVASQMFEGSKYTREDVEDAERRLANIPFSAAHIGDKKAKKETLNAFEGLRMKAYGLKTLSGSMVQQVADLEKQVLPHINLKTGEFSGDMESLLSAFGGIGDSEKAVKVRYWFRHRFLPVFTTFVMAVKRYLPNVDPLNLVLTGRYLYEIASFVMQAKATINGVSTSVWYIRQVPWDEVNDDPSTVTDELATLKKLSKDTELRVDVLPTDKQTAKVNLNKNRYDGSALQKIQEGQPSTASTPSNVMQFPTRDGSTVSAPAVTTGGGIADTLRHAPVINQEPGEGDYRSIKQSKEGAPDIINEAAKVAGVNPLVMMTMAMIESSLNPNAAAKTSSAKGLYQFLDGTWKEMMRKYANKYGIPEGTDQFDPVANSLLGAEFLKENAKVSESVMNRPASAVDYYIPHFFGAGGARTFYRQLMKNPNAPAAQTMTKQANANKPIFYQNGKPRSFAEVYQYFTRKMSSNESHARKYVSVPASNASNNVVDMFSNVPAYNDARREDVVKAKADRDTQAAAPTTNTSVASASSAYGGGSEPAPAPSPRAMENKAKAFAAENPNATDADKEAYADRMAHNAYGGQTPEAGKEPNPVLRSNEILSQQLTVQQSMAGELVNIRKLLQMVLDGKEGSREYDQLKTDIARQDAKPKPSLTVEHGQSRVNTKRVSNM